MNSSCGACAQGDPQDDGAAQHAVVACLDPVDDHVASSGRPAFEDGPGPIGVQALRGDPQIDRTRTDRLDGPAEIAQNLLARGEMAPGPVHHLGNGAVGGLQDVSAQGVASSGWVHE